MSNTQRFAVEHEAALRAFRERLGAVTTAATAAPTLTSDALSQQVPIDLRQPSAVSRESGNARLFLLEMLQSYTARPPVMLGANINRLRDLDAWLANTSQAPSGLGIGDMEQLLALEYVIIARPSVAEAPQQAPGDTFTPGRVAGDALVFRLADQAQLGGVRFAATNTEGVRVSGAAATNEGLDRTISLRANLSVQAHRAIGAALTGVLPGVVLDATWR